MSFDFARAYRLIWSPECKLSLARRAILTVIVRHADQRTGDRLRSKARIGTRRICECTGMSGRAVVDNTMDLPARKGSGGRNDRPATPMLAKDPALPFGLELLPSKRVSCPPTYLLTLPPEEPRRAERGSARGAERGSAQASADSAERGSLPALNPLPTGAEPASADPTSGVATSVSYPQRGREFAPPSGTRAPACGGAGSGDGKADGNGKSPDHARLLAVYVKGFTFDRGYGPSRPEVVDRGVAALLAAVGVERGVALIERAFAPGSYWRGKGLTIGQIARNPDAYDRDPDHPLLRKVNGKRPPQQSDNPIFSPSSLLDVEPS